MSIFMSRDGSISVFRVGVAAALIGLALGIGAFVFAQIDQARRQSPFNIDPPNGAIEWRTGQPTETSRKVLYQVPEMTAEEVAAYYQQKLDKHTGSSPNDPRREQCVRHPASGQFPDFGEGTGTVPYQFRCVFDNSLAGGLFSSGAVQFTVVTIQPGVLNLETEIDTRGSTMVEYEQSWSS